MNSFNLTTFMVEMIKAFGLQGVLAIILIIVLFFNKKERETVQQQNREEREQALKAYQTLNEKSTQALVENTRVLSSLKTIVEMRRD